MRARTRSPSRKKSTVRNCFSYKGHLSQVLRNDFASRSTPVPWRLSSNWGGPLFYGYFAEKFPPKREYALHTDRWQDFNPPLNQVHLTLSETEAPGVLRVDADTETPFFQTFLSRIDEGGLDGRSRDVFHLAPSRRAEYAGRSRP